MCEDFETFSIADTENLKNEVKFLNESWSDLTEKLSDMQRFMVNFQNNLITFDDIERSIGDLFDVLDDGLHKQSFVSASPIKCEQFEKAVKVKL